MKKTNNHKYINAIAQKIEKIRRPVSNQCARDYSRLKVFDCLKGAEILPDPFEIADYYQIEYRFISLKNEMPSYLKYSKKDLGTIYISNKYHKDSYEAKILCAHELGHYFLHDVQNAAMNNDSLNDYLPNEIIKEYEANVFAILLMPQIMGSLPWQEYSPKYLNKLVYEKI